jgi:uncharacterized cupredoxin-like copper-binding protein
MVNARFRLALIGLALATPVHAAESVTVVLRDNRFEPSRIVLHAGQTYALLLENRGREMHEFTAPAFLKAATIPDKHLLSNAGTDIVVPSGKSVTIVLTAPGKGQYDLSCADHDWDGMTGSIVVN